MEEAVPRSGVGNFFTVAHAVQLARAVPIYLPHLLSCCCISLPSILPSHTPPHLPTQRYPDEEEVEGATRVASGVPAKPQPHEEEEDQHPSREQLQAGPSEVSVPAGVVPSMDTRRTATTTTEKAGVAQMISTGRGTTKGTTRTR